jgi:hypothetical protein
VRGRLLFLATPLALVDLMAVLPFYLPTVGYGDIYPITPRERFIGSIVVILGIGLFALPTGVLASGFAEVLARRKEEQKMHKFRCPHCRRYICDLAEANLLESNMIYKTIRKSEMMIKMLIAVLSLISMNLVVNVTASETIDLGPAHISLEPSSLGPFSVEKGETSSMAHKEPDFQYNITSACIKVNGTAHLVQIEVHQMSLSEPLLSPISNEDHAGKIGNYFQALTAYLPDSISNNDPPRRENISGLEHCMEKSNMIPIGGNIQTEPYTIDGRQGCIATINRDPENPMYIVAYSPDEQNESGTIVCIIGSDFPWEATEKLFKSVKI